MKSIFSRTAIPWPKDQKGQTRRSYTVAKQIYRSRIGMLQTTRSAAFIILGIFSAGFGLKSFLLPNNFIDGGATGISLLLSGIFHFPLPIIIILVNIPFILLGYRQIGYVFTMRTVLSIIGLAICLALVNYPPVTNDKLLVAVFGGFFLAQVSGLPSGVVVYWMARRCWQFSSAAKQVFTIGDIILVINILIFSSAVYFLDLETALYSMLTYLSASRTVDFLIEGIEEYLGVTIISRKNDEIRKMIVEVIGRGVTIYKGIGGVGKRGPVNQEMDIVFTVVTRLEISRLRSEIEKIDDDAFVVMHSIKDTKGGMIKKRPLKEH
jgi:uncharacterized membrane-anchored protein YitT (DUF2179 family)